MEIPGQLSVEINTENTLTDLALRGLNKTEDILGHTGLARVINVLETPTGRVNKLYTMLVSAKEVDECRRHNAVWYLKEKKRQDLLNKMMERVKESSQLDLFKLKAKSDPVMKKLLKEFEGVN